MCRCIFVCSLNLWLFYWRRNIILGLLGLSAAIPRCRRTNARGSMTNPINSTNECCRTYTIYVSSQSHCKYLVLDASGLALVLSLYRPVNDFMNRSSFPHRHTGYTFVNNDYEMAPKRVFLKVSLGSNLFVYLYLRVTREIGTCFWGDGTRDSAVNQASHMTTCWGARGRLSANLYITQLLTSVISYDDVHIAILTNELSKYSVHTFRRRHRFAYCLIVVLYLFSIKFFKISLATKMLRSLRLFGVMFTAITGWCHRARHSYERARFGIFTSDTSTLYSQ